VPLKTGKSGIERVCSEYYNDDGSHERVALLKIRNGNYIFENIPSEVVVGKEKSCDDNPTDVANRPLSPLANAAPRRQPDERAEPCSCAEVGIMIK